MATGSTTRLFVAAIDFGTTYSGYAYASVKDLKDDTGKIVTNIWNSGSYMSQKAPTCILLNPDQEFDCFGYDAETKYSQMAGEDEEDYKDWYYFYRFKMSLYNNRTPVKRDMMLEDINGKKMKAIDVFSECIRYLKEHMFQSMVDKIPDIQQTDITYVLTVPAIWDDSAKQFMRKAAVEGGIKNDQLIIALEPEAASIYCQKLPIEKVETDDGRVQLTVGKVGSRYLIADLGGGTADITVHEKMANDKIKEIHCACGGAMGGKSVDDAFLKFLEEIVGKEAMDAFKGESMEDYVELLREFESKKRETGTEKSKVNVSIPVALKTVVKKTKSLKLEDVINQSNFNKTVTFSRNQKLQILQSEFKQFYHSTVTGIVNQISDIVKTLKDGDINTIVMVGGFSDCSLIRSELLANEFTKNRRIIIPEDAGLAVLKGAVLYGYKPETVFARVARKTYGIQTWPMFREGVHPESKKVIVAGVERCKDIFFKYVEKGQEVMTGHRMSQVFQALGSEDDCLECTVYVSDESDPMYVTDESCTMLGVLNIPLGSSSRERKEIEETLIFGETELRVHARDLSTGKVVECNLDLM